MTLSFFAVRILVMPIYWMKVYQVYGTEAFLRTGHVQMVLLVTCVVLDIINLFWFYKMLKGVHKVLRVNFDKNYNDTSRKIQQKILVLHVVFIFVSGDVERNGVYCKPCCVHSFLYFFSFSFKRNFVILRTIAFIYINCMP